MKRCTKCGVEKAADQFYRVESRCRDCDNARSRAWHAKNREYANEKSRQWKVAHPGYSSLRKREWRNDNPDRAAAMDRKTQLLRLYGLSRSAYDAMLLQQANRCAICRQEFAAQRGPCVDHDHQTGEVRGLVHKSCNVGLGFYEKQGSLYADYLSRHPRLKIV